MLLSFEILKVGLQKCYCNVIRRKSYTAILIMAARAPKKFDLWSNLGAIVFPRFIFTKVEVRI